MVRQRSGQAGAFAIVIVGLLVGGTAQLSIARMTSSATVGSNTFTTAAHFDTTPPTVASSVISKTVLYLAGYIHQGGTYYVYANITDAGSGVASATANVSNITTGSTAVAVVAGSYSVEGVSYNYRSASLTAKNPLTAGSVTYSITAVDGSGNSGTTAGLTVVVDNTVPAGSNILLADGGGTAGTIQLGDTITFTFNDVIDPQSVLAGWTGASTNVVVRFTDSGANDTFAIWNSTNTAQLAVGTVNTKGDYVMPGGATAGLSGTASTMVLNTSTDTIRVTLGTVAGMIKNDNKKRAPAWTPSASATDRAGNAESTTVVNGANLVGF